MSDVVSADPLQLPPSLVMLLSEEPGRRVGVHNCCSAAPCGKSHRMFVVVRPAPGRHRATSGAPTPLIMTDDSAGSGGDTSLVSSSPFRQGCALLYT